MTWLVWFLFAFGLVYLVVGASITAWPRRFLFNLLGPRWGGALACAPCASFWVGVAVGLPQTAVIVDLVPWVLVAPWLVTVAVRLAAGVILMGAVVLVQVFGRTLIAEIGAEAATKKREETDA